MISTAPQPALSFDPATHAYSVDGRRLPSVTQIIRSLIPGWQVDEWYLHRGKALHRACELLDQSRLELSSVDPQIAGRLKAWEKFKAAFPAEVIASEHIMFDEVHGFAGTLDRVFLHDGKLIVVDIKSTIEPVVELQLGAYKLLWDRGSRGLIKFGVAVELSDDGSFRTHWLRSQREMDLAGRTFLAALTIHNFMQRKNIKPQKEKSHV